jgi:hypothetical protein
MSRIRELQRGTITPPQEGDLDGVLLLAQAGILAKIGKALDLQAGLAAITGPGGRVGRDHGPERPVWREGGAG